jgi:hypothetical protein
MALDYFELSDVANNIRRIEDIFATNIFAPDNLITNPLGKSAFIEVMICLQDLLAKADKISKRISFKDDVQVYNTKAKHKDITDLVFAIRNSCCHIQSELHKIPPTSRAKNIRAKYNVVIGKGEPELYGIKFKSDYPDEICFFYGEHKIYLGRHIVRAYNEAIKVFKPLL